MKIVGMLDSPFVRRTVISAALLEIPIEHQQLSILRNFAEFRALNPLVKVPTLVFDDGSVMVDSSQIIAYLESLAGRSLMPWEPEDLRRCLQFTSLGLAAAEKSVQRFYETSLRPEGCRWPEWIARCDGQLRDTYAMLEGLVGGSDAQSEWLCGGAEPSQADITVAVAWRFTHNALPGLLATSDYPRLAALAVHAEALPAFFAADFG
jgi:glutathione S-transferase